jgi:hypothetical protein
MTCDDGNMSIPKKCAIMDGKAQRVVPVNPDVLDLLHLPEVP